MKFEEALKLLRAGKKVRRPEWEKDTYIYMSCTGFLINDKDEITTISYIDVDWEEYREPFKLSPEEKEVLKNVLECVENFPSVEYAYRVDKRVDYSENYEYLRIWYKIKGGDTNHYICSPQFSKGTMFECFDPLDYYKIEELDLYDLKK